MNDPLSNTNPYQPWKTEGNGQQQAGQALDAQIQVPDEIANRLAAARREAVQAVEQKQRARRPMTTSTWTIGLGLVAAAVSAVVIAPRILEPTPSATPLPAAMIAAEEDLEFFESLEILEWSVNNESTS